MSRLRQYGQRSNVGFDKYTALGMVKTASREAHVSTMKRPLTSKPRPGRSVRSLKSQPTDFNHISHAFQLIENTLKCWRALKVDKLLDRKSTASDRPAGRFSRVVCFYCGIPRHIATNCYRRNQRRWRGRSSPYERRRGSFQASSNPGQNLRHWFNLDIFVCAIYARKRVNFYKYDNTTGIFFND